MALRQIAQLDAEVKQIEVMCDNTPWCSQEAIDLELVEETRQDRLAEEAYRGLLELPDASVARTDEF